MEKRFCGGRGFTLIELLVVIAIIAILAVPRQ
jgi:prepilin-type N-terminal cleavage/methylation domain-containing protein